MATFKFVAHALLVLIFLQIMQAVCSFHVLPYFVLSSFTCMKCIYAFIPHSFHIQLSIYIYITRVRSFNEYLLYCSYIRVLCVISTLSSRSCSCCMFILLFFLLFFFLESYSCTHRRYCCGHSFAFYPCECFEFARIRSSAEHSQRKWSSFSSFLIFLSPFFLSFSYRSLTLF